jgi:Flp pilus assembly protein TadD
LTIQFRSGKKRTSRTQENQETKNAWENALSQKKVYERSQLESLVQRYPNDYGYRYELGLNLFENEDYDNCLSHFQLAQRNAKVRLGRYPIFGTCLQSQELLRPSY